MFKYFFIVSGCVVMLVSGARLALSSSVSGSARTASVPEVASAISSGPLYAQVTLSPTAEPIFQLPLVAPHFARCAPNRKAPLTQDELLHATKLENKVGCLVEIELKTSRDLVRISHGEHAPYQVLSALGDSTTKLLALSELFAPGSQELELWHTARSHTGFLVDLKLLLINRPSISEQMRQFFNSSDQDAGAIIQSASHVLLEDYKTSDTGEMVLPVYTLVGETNPPLYLVSSRPLAPSDERSRAIIAELVDTGPLREFDLLQEKELPAQIGILTLENPEAFNERKTRFERFGLRLGALLFVFGVGLLVSGIGWQKFKQAKSSVTRVR